LGLSITTYNYNRIANRGASGAGPHRTPHTGHDIAITTHHAARLRNPGHPEPGGSINVSFCFVTRRKEKKQQPANREKWEPEAGGER
jgi:hypothetical protein